MNEGMQMATNLFRECIGKSAKNVTLGYGSFITLDFGEKQILIEVKTKKGTRSSYRGEWHLWIYMAAWRVDQRERSIIGANDPREEIEKALIILENKKLEKVIILNTAYDALLEFQDGVRLSLFSFKIKDSEQWLLFTPTDHVFKAGPGNTWKYEDES